MPWKGAKLKAGAALGEEIVRIEGLFRSVVATGVYVIGECHLIAPLIVYRQAVVVGLLGRVINEDTHEQRTVHLVQQYGAQRITGNWPKTSNPF